jgi:hypothetical protein
MSEKRKPESAELEFLLGLLADPIQRQIISLISAGSGPDEVIDAIMKTIRK